MRKQATWLARGLVETDEVRRVIFAARTVPQLDEIWHRRAQARQADASSPYAFADERGFAVLPPLSTPEVRAAFEVAQPLAEAARGATGRLGKKSFHLNRMVDLQTLDPRSPLVELGTTPALVAAVTAKLGQVPVLADIDVFCSFSTGSRPFAASQLYHCDDTAASQVKVFVYLTDVGPEDGPLHLLDASSSAEVRRALHYRYAGRRYRVPDDVLAAHAPRPPVQVCGAAGTTIVADTSRCFHMGSRIEDPSRFRAVLLLQYVPTESYELPLPFRGRAPLRHLVQPWMTPAAKAVLGTPAKEAYR